MNHKRSEREIKKLSRQGISRLSRDKKDYKRNGRNYITSDNPQQRKFVVQSDYYYNNQVERLVDEGYSESQAIDVVFNRCILET